MSQSIRYHQSRRRRLFQRVEVAACCVAVPVLFGIGFFAQITGAQ